MFDPCFSCGDDSVDQLTGCDISVVLTVHEEEVLSETVQNKFCVLSRSSNPNRLQDGFRYRGELSL